MASKPSLESWFLLGAVICVVYVLSPLMQRREGMTNNRGNDNDPAMAGKAATYAASVKTATVKMQDVSLISKYRADYETTILNLDDWIEARMLQTVMSVDLDHPDAAIAHLAELQQAKAALNSTLKYVDKN